MADPQIPLRSFWRRRGLGNVALLPLSLLFLLAATLRRLAYRAGIFRVYRPGVPVIISGCITAGGGGKTTLTIALVEGLRERGLVPGVISHGHGRMGFGATLVSPEDDPAQMGDEAVMVSAVAKVPVAVAKSRPDAARLLLKDHPDIDVIVSDDGLQHLALGRDIELVVLSDGFGLGNGWLLPAGPLRERPSRLRSVDAVVRKGSPRAESESELALGQPELLNAEGKAITAADLSGQRVVAVAGIAEPEGFFGDLRKHGVDPVECVAFPDHHHYSADDLLALKADLVVMTEKDEIKCRRLGDDRIAVFRRHPTLDPILLDEIANRVNEARTA